MKEIKDLVVGDVVWTIQNGWTTVIELNPGGTYCVATEHDCYTSTGLQHTNYAHPSLFTYDPLNGTEPPVEYEVGEFYKVKTGFDGDCFVAECCDKDGVFEAAGWAYDLSEVTDIVLMKEVV